MSLNRVASKYAASLLSLTVEQGILPAVSADMESINKILTSAPRLKRIIKDPTVKPSLKSSVLKEVFKDRLSDLTNNFIRVLIQKNRIEVLAEIPAKFIELRNQHLGIVPVTVTSAEEMSGPQVDALRSKLESVLGKKVEFTFKKDANLIGGFVAKAGDTVIDSSVKQQLHVLKNKFLTSSFSVN